MEIQDLELAEVVEIKSLHKQISSGVSLEGGLCRMVHDSAHDVKVMLV